MPSCRVSGFDLVILQPTLESFKFADKRAILADHLPQVCDADSLVMFTDAYDTLFVAGPEHVERAYRRFPERVVFGAELNSWPLGPVGYAMYGDEPVGRYPYLNSGGFIGPAGELLELCAKYPVPPSDRFDVLVRLRAHGYDPDERFGFSDQYHWTLVHLLERERVGLDHDADIFEYFGPPIPEVSLRVLSYEFKEFQAQGRESAGYQRERERLEARLREPSGAAQLHFASYLSKAVVLDLLDEGRLPPWIRAAYEAPPAANGSVQVHQV